LQLFAVNGCSIFKLKEGEKMKKIILILFVFSSSLFSQASTLLGNTGEISHGGFGAPVVKFTNINGEFGVLCGARGGWIIDHRVSLGLGVYGLATNTKLTNAAAGETRYLQFEYGGFEFEYILASDEVIHLTFSGLLGGGETDYRLNKFGEEGFGREEFNDRDVFFIGEPTLKAEVNITSFFRVNLGIGYRFVSGVDNSYIAENKLNDFSGSIQFKFGSF
jgi:hypothetical protein